MAEITFQQKTKTMAKLIDNGITSEKDLQNLNFDSVLQIPGITMQDLAVVSQLQKHTKDNKLYEIFGDLKVFPTYVTSDGFKLGNWIDNQREKYRTGAIKQYRFDRLSEIEMIWKLPDPWEVRFEIAKKYYEEHGPIALMPGQYTEKGMAIGKWINEQKHIRKGKRKGQTLTDEQIRKLDSIGMWWGNQHDFVWEKTSRQLSNSLRIQGT